MIADLAHAQDGLVGYVHPFDWPIVPEKEASLTHQLPADVINGKVDYLEVVSFADHKATAEVWYRLLNLGFHLPAAAGTDAMANYASLRGPVGHEPGVPGHRRQPRHRRRLRRLEVGPRLRQQCAAAGIAARWQEAR